MKTTFISTLSLVNAPKSNLARMQTELARASVEVSTGRHADVGLALGRETGRALSLRKDFSQIETLIDSNSLLNAQLGRSQSALAAMAEGANDFLKDIIIVADSPNSSRLLKEQAQLALSSFISIANSTDGRGSLFGGINTGVAPIADFEGAPGVAIDAAFSAAFGIPLPDPQDNPLAAGITPAAMQAFLDGDFADLFEVDANWQDWSSASDTALSSRISPDERIDTSVTANEPAMRKLAMAYSMVAALGIDNLAPETLQVVVKEARKVLGAAISGLTDMQGRIGIAEERASSANERMTLEKDIVSNAINALEGADPIEAKVRFDTITTQVEMSYALTNKMLRLSILNYA